MPISEEATLRKVDPLQLLGKDYFNWLHRAAVQNGRFACGPCRFCIETCSSQNSIAGQKPCFKVSARHSFPQAPELFKIAMVFVSSLRTCFCIKQNWHLVTSQLVGSCNPPSEECNSANFCRCFLQAHLLSFINPWGGWKAEVLAKEWLHLLLSPKVHNNDLVDF